jgi:hypothetical protein
MRDPVTSLSEDTQAQLRTDADFSSSNIAHDTEFQDFESDVTIFDTEAATEDVLSTDSATESGASSSSQTSSPAAGTLTNNNRTTTRISEIWVNYNEELRQSNASMSIGDESAGSVTAVSEETDSDSDSVGDQSVSTGRSSDDETTVVDDVVDDEDGDIFQSTVSGNSHFSRNNHARSRSVGSSSHFPFSRHLIDLGAFWYRNQDPRRVQFPPQL